METTSSTIDWPVALEQNRSWLTKVLRSRIGDRREVDDILQEIALAVVRMDSKDDSGDHDSSAPTDPDKVSSWLYRIAVRRAVDFHRRSYRKVQVTPVAEIESESRDAEPLDWMMRQEQRHLLANSVARLNPEHREILTLKYTENWSYQQLADRLGTTVRSVEHRLLQARQQLRRYLADEK